jgi:hypothetical protein
MRLCSSLALLSFFALTAAAQPPISSVAIGLYGKDEKVQLAPAFINSVNDYLHRYEPTLVTKQDDYVKMRVDYDFLYDIEMRINADDYEIKVTLAQKISSVGKAQKQAAHLSSGVYRTMERAMLRRERLR